MTRILFAVFALFCSGFIAPAQETTQIVWEKEYRKALALARETNRPLLLDFAADWCKPCIRMDAEFWVLPDVVEAVKGFVAVKVDYDAEKSLVEKYKVRAIPFVIFTDPLGNAITSRRGFSSKNVAELNKIFDEMPKDFSPLKPFYDALELKKDDGFALLKIADAYRGAKMVQLSSEFYKKALKTPEIRADVEKKELAMTALGVNSYNLKDHEQAVEDMEDYLKEFPEGKNKEMAIAILTIANAGRKKMKDANKYLELLKEQFPSSKYLAMATNAVENARNKKEKN